MAEVDNDIILTHLQDIFKERDGLKVFLQELLKVAMEAELTEHLKAGPYQRSSDRGGHRNGYKGRTFSTRIGQLELSVPQSRHCDPYHPTMFGRWQRSERALLCACAEMYFQGISTRKVNEVLEMMCSMEISSATVSRISSEIDAKLSQFVNRSLKAAEYPFIIIDARYEKVRVEGRIVSQAVLVSAGIDTLGRREILDWRVCDSESQETWSQVFKSLKDRGLSGVEVIVSDAHKGIRAAVARHFQGVQWQRCRVHFKRELAKKLAYKQRKSFLHDLNSVYKGNDKMECLLRSRELIQLWQRKKPAIAKLLEDGIEDTLAVCSYPPAIAIRIASTNMLENIMKQLKSRTKVVGIFPNMQSCYRLTGALLLEIHEQWLCAENPYMQELNNYYRVDETN